MTPTPQPGRKRPTQGTTAPKAQRLRILERDSWTCQRCGRRLQNHDPTAADYMHAGHVIDWIEGGASALDTDYRAECRACSQSAGGAAGVRSTRNTRARLEAERDELRRERDRLAHELANQQTRRVVLLIGPPGAGKTTAAHATGLPVFDFDDPRWTTDTFDAALTRVGTDPHAQAVVIRAATTPGVRTRTARQVNPTETYHLDAPDDVLISRITARQGEPPTRYQLRGIHTWRAHPPDGIPPWPGSTTRTQQTQPLSRTETHSDTTDLNTAHRNAAQRASKARSIPPQRLSRNETASNTTTLDREEGDEPRGFFSGTGGRQESLLPGYIPVAPVTPRKVERSKLSNVAPVTPAGVGVKDEPSKLSKVPQLTEPRVKVEPSKLSKAAAAQPISGPESAGGVTDLGPFDGRGVASESAAAQRFSVGESVGAVTGFASFRESRPEDFAGCPWMADLLRPPKDARWPRFMSGPHPAAVGSMGRDLERSARKRGKPLRWWQRLVARRVLEVDRFGRLCWGEFLITLARQGGKSWLLRELAMWRLESARLIGEEQLVMHVANKLSNANEVQRPARSWASTADGWISRNGQGTQHIAAPDGSRWFLFSSESVYGWSAGLALVDECWDVEPSVVSDGVEPAMTERLWPQLGLLSTAHPRATSLFIDRRRAALEGGDALLIEWSARSWLDLDDRDGWKAAAPHWSAQRERLIAKALAKALRPSSRRPNEPDPVESFRCQWLNQWPERSTDDTNLPGQRLLPPGAWELLEADDAPCEPAVFAVDDRGGLSVAVAAAARCASGRIVVEAYPETDRRTAYEWVRVHADPGSSVLVGPSLQYDSGVVELSGLMSEAVQTFGDTRSALAALRQLVTRNAVCHTGSGELAAQVEACRVADGSAGLRVISSDAWDLVRVAAWAVAGADRSQRGAPSVF